MFDCSVEAYTSLYQSENFAKAMGNGPSAQSD